MLLSTLCQSKTAVLLPIGIVGYASLEDSVEYSEKFAAYSDQDVHFGFALLNPALEVSTVPRHKSYGPYRKHLDSFAYILIASMAHLGMFQSVVASLEALRTPAEVG